MQTFKVLMDNGGAALLIAALFQRHSPGARLTYKYIFQRTWEIAMEVMTDDQIPFLRSATGWKQFEDCLHQYLIDNLNKTVRVIAGPTGGIELCS